MLCDWTLRREDGIAIRASATAGLTPSYGFSKEHSLIIDCTFEVERLLSQPVVHVRRVFKRFQVAVCRLLTLGWSWRELTPRSS